MCLLFCFACALVNCGAKSDLPFSDLMIIYKTGNQMISHKASLSHVNSTFSHMLHFYIKRYNFLVSRSLMSVFSLCWEVKKDDCTSRHIPFPSYKVNVHVKTWGFNHSAAADLDRIPEYSLSIKSISIISSYLYSWESLDKNNWN